MGLTAKATVVRHCSEGAPGEKELQMVSAFAAEAEAFLHPMARAEEDGPKAEQS